MYIDFFDTDYFNVYLFLADFFKLYVHVCTRICKSIVAFLKAYSTQKAHVIHKAIICECQEWQDRFIFSDAGYVI
jgi:hypothetical protein